MDSSGLLVDDQMLPSLDMSTDHSQKLIQSPQSFDKEDQSSHIDLVDPKSIDDVNLKSKEKQAGTNIVTLKPREKVSFRKNKFRSNPLLVHFDSLFGVGSWSRYLVLKTSSKISALKLENILLTKCPTQEMSFRMIRPNEWLIETTTQSQSETFLSLNDIEGIDVSVKRHDTLNSIQGTVVLPTVDDDDDAPSKLILMDSLNKRYNNIQDIEIYEVPNRKYPGNPLKIAKIKFEGQTLPQKIKILGQSREVRPFVPKPLQCRSCSKFGHTESRCRGTPVCAFCSSKDHPTKWNCGYAKCVNCGLDHHARSKDCTFYMYNTELKILVGRTGMSFKEAKLELRAKGFKDPASNPMYKSKLRNIIPPKTMEIYSNSMSNAKEEVNYHEPKRFKPTNKDQDEILSKNFFEILTTEVEVHQENEVDDNEIDQALSENNFKAQESRKEKRTYDKVSPVKNSANSNSSTRPKIQRNSKISNDMSETTLTKEILPSQTFSKTKEKEQNNNVSDISPSPIFPTKFKNTNKSVSSINHDKNCKCINCFQNEIDQCSPTSHNNLCGCHDCFIKEANSVKPLTKEKLINIIKSFIVNRKVDSDSQLELHCPDCMCTNHLNYYKKNKITILEKFLSKQNNKNEKSNTSTEN